jgi:hypothetical protein
LLLVFVVLLLELLSHSTDQDAVGAARRIDDLTPDVEALCKTVYKQPDGDWRTFAAMDY